MCVMTAIDYDCVLSLTRSLLFVLKRPLAATILWLSPTLRFSILEKDHGPSLIVTFMPYWRTIIVRIVRK